MCEIVKMIERASCVYRFLSVPSLLAALLVCVSFSPALTQERSAITRPPDIMGLERGERDTMRVDFRLGGKQERDSEARMSGERVRPDEMRIRREVQGSDLLRSQAELKMRAVRRERADELRAAAQRKLDEQIQENRREFRFENFGAP